MKRLHVMKITTKYLNENIIASLMFLPSLYYSLANLFNGFTILYFLTFSLGAISYILLLIRRPKIFLLFGTFIVLILSYSLIINPKLFNFILSSSSLVEFSKSKIILLLLVYLPVLITSMNGKLNYSYFIHKMYSYSLIILPLNLIVSYQRIAHSDFSDYITIAYEILFWTFFCIVGAIQNRKKIALIIIVPAALTLTTGGSRGALLCFLVILFLLYIATFLRTLTKKSVVRRLIIISFLLVFGIIISFSFSNLITSLEGVLSNVGYSSRVLDYIQTSNLFFNDSRFSLYSEITPHLFDYFFGSGIFADRFLIASNQYVHNLFLELLINYGVMLGSVIIVLIILKSINVILMSIKTKDPNIQYLAIFAITYLFVKFMISASYLQSSEFFLAFGFIYNITRFNKRGSIV